MNPIVWKPTQNQIDISQIENFRKLVNARFNINLKDYYALHDWSVSNIADFWKAIWGFGDERVILFIMLNDNHYLSKELILDIKKSIRSNCSPHHVPDIVMGIEDIPYTINGKKVEIAVKRMIQGENVDNKDSLTNPESLELYRKIKELS